LGHFETRVNRLAAASSATTATPATTAPTGFSATATRRLRAIAIGLSVAELITVPVVAAAVVPTEAVGVMAAATAAVTMPESTALESAGLPLVHREFRNWTGRRLRAFNLGKCCAYQTAVQRKAFGSAVGGRSVFRCHDGRGRLDLCNLDRDSRCDFHNRHHCFWCRCRLWRHQHTGRLTRRRLRFLSWHSCPFELMLGVAGGTPGLTNGIADNGDNSVIGHASFTRTIVIDDIAEPQRALLHSQKLPNRNSI
jgi:hypothetical protein